jgi:hypothetical protein
VSARDELMDFVRANESDNAFSYVHPKGHAFTMEEALTYVDRLLSLHAHELAEKIRVHFDVKGKPCPAPGGYVNPARVADLTDPEVE